MKSLLTALAMASSLPFTQAYLKGFTVLAKNANGTCKTTAQWDSTFRLLQSLPGNFSSTRLFASSDCDALANAVPAAIATGQTLLAGVWSQNASHYAAEKAALEAAIHEYGNEWLVAVAVGSEDLFRGQTNASVLAQQLYDVRGMIRAAGAMQEVGHVDDWTVWTNANNTPVILASDFIGADYYPYFTSSSISTVNATFWSSIASVRAAVAAVRNNTQVWLTETGWPVSGPELGKAEASVANTQSYWRSVGCGAFKDMNTYWYSLQDYNTTSSMSFGAVGATEPNLYVAAC